MDKKKQSSRNLANGISMEEICTMEKEVS